MVRYSGGPITFSPPLCSKASISSLPQQNTSPMMLAGKPWVACCPVMLGVFGWLGFVGALASGYGEVVDLAEQGWVRVLCIAAPERLATASDVPTCHEAGAKNLEFVNWRGFFASPGLSKENQDSYYELFEKLTQHPQWQVARERFGWVSLYTSGPGFATLLKEQEAQLAPLLDGLGI